jgi:peptidoglycan hydrolase-like protein with peptidoglycan-binding domain
LRVASLGRFSQKGDTGFEVLELQQALTDRGYATKTDGHWGDETEQQIRAFTRSGLGSL